MLQLIWRPKILFISTPIRTDYCLPASIHVKQLASCPHVTLKHGARNHIELNWILANWCTVISIVRPSVRRHPRTTLLFIACEAEARRRSDPPNGQQKARSRLASRPGKKSWLNAVGSDSSKGHRNCTEERKSTVSWKITLYLQTCNTSVCIPRCSTLKTTSYARV